MEIMKLCLVTASISCCKAVSLRRQLDHIAKARAESYGLYNQVFPSRRSLYSYDPREIAGIVGVPSSPSHLPEAEPILPGHTLIRPSLGMLKSAIKFPHQELENGAGVYGNIENLGIRYDAKNERVLNTGFRRSASDYIMVLPTKPQHNKPKFQIASTVLDLDKKDFKDKLLKALEKLNVPLSRGNNKIYIASIQQNNVDESEDPIKIIPDIDYQDHRWGTSKYKEVSDERPKRFVPVHSKYFYNIRAGNRIAEDKELLRSPPSSNSLEDIPTTTTRVDVKGDKKLEKMEWFLNSKNSFDHIRVNKNAPDHLEFIPKASKEKLRQWWFFNQHDYKTFSEERRRMNNTFY